MILIVWLASIAVIGPLMPYVFLLMVWGAMI